MKVGLVTTNREFFKDGSNLEIELINDALNKSGLNSSLVVWHEEHEWASFDALIFRSPWDYPERRQEFMGWLDHVQAFTRIMNPPPLIRWNLDKRYLVELSGHEVSITPTTYCDTYDECLEAISGLPSERYVVKPNVSVGSRDTGLFSGGDCQGPELCQAILDSGRTVLVQPAIDSIQQDAERGLVFFNGELSHVIKKGAILRPGGGYLGGKYVEHISLSQASPDEVALGVDALKAIQSISLMNRWGTDAEVPLYARIDVATPRPGDAPILLEAELFEPSIFVRYSPEGLKRFVEAVRIRVLA